MAYVVYILSAKPQRVAKEAGRPSFRLPKVFLDLEEAYEAAFEHIQGFGCLFSDLAFHIVDAGGKILVTSDDPVAPLTPPAKSGGDGVENPGFPSQELAKYFLSFLFLTVVVLVGLLAGVYLACDAYFRPAAQGLWSNPALVASYSSPVVFERLGSYLVADPVFLWVCLGLIGLLLVWSCCLAAMLLVVSHSE